MLEYDIVWLCGLSGIGLVIGSLLYSFGGRTGIGKWVRRFLGSLVIASTVNIVTFMLGNWNIKLFLIYPVLAIGFSLGYGADILLIKIIRRLIFACGVVSAGLLFVWVYGSLAFWIFPLHMGIGLFSVYLGIKNPISAPAEEFFICMLLNLGLMIYPFLI